MLNVCVLYPYLSLPSLNIMVLEDLGYKARQGRLQIMDSNEWISWRVECVDFQFVDFQLENQYYLYYSQKKLCLWWIIHLHSKYYNTR